MLENHFGLNKLVFGSVCVAGAAALLFAADASAEVMDLTPSGDTTVWNRDGHGWQDENSGSALSVDLHGESNGNINAFGYIQFDLTSLNIDTITSATLTVTRISPNPQDTIGSSRSAGDNDWTDAHIDFYGLDNVAGNTVQDWDEGVLTFNLTGNEVTETSANNANPFVSGTVTDFSTLNTTGNDDSAAGTDTSTLTGAALVAWLNGRVDDNGLVTILVATGLDGSGSGVGFYSKEGAADVGNLAVAPTLTIDYTLIPEPASLMLLGAGGLLMAARRRRG